MVDIACIGHITQDHIITPSTDYFAPGGTAYYISEGIDALLRSNNFATNDSSSSPLSFQLVTKEGRKHFFENIYSDNMNNRQQRVITTADNFSINELQDISARYIIIGSLLASDFSVKIIKMLSEKGIVVLDVQGFLREVKNQQVYNVDWKEKHEALKYVDVIKVNEYEMQVLTGKDNAYEAAKVLAEWGVKEILLTFGSYGSLVYDATNHKFYDIPAFPPKKIIDATGCGDTYVMAYIFKRASGESIPTSALFASQISGAKLMFQGPYT